MKAIVISIIIVLGLIITLNMLHVLANFIKRLFLGKNAFEILLSAVVSTEILLSAVVSTLGISAFIIVLLTQAFKEFYKMPYSAEPESIYVVSDGVKTIDIDTRIDHISFLDDADALQDLYYTEIEVASTKENTYIEMYVKSDPEEIFSDMTLIKVYVNEDESDFYDYIWLKVAVERAR